MALSSSYQLIELTEPLLMLGSQLLHEMLELLVAQLVYRLLALGLEELLMTQSIFNVKQFLGTHVHHLRP